MGEHVLDTLCANVIVAKRDLPCMMTAENCADDTRDLGLFVEGCEDSNARGASLVHQCKATVQWHGSMGIVEVPGQGVGDELIRLQDTKH